MVSRIVFPLGIKGRILFAFARKTPRSVGYLCNRPGSGSVLRDYADSAFMLRREKTRLRNESQCSEQEAGGSENRSNYPAHETGFDGAYFSFNGAYFSFNEVFRGSFAVPLLDSVRNNAGVRFGMGLFDAGGGKIGSNGKGIDHGSSRVVVQGIRTQRGAMFLTPKENPGPSLLSSINSRPVHKKSQDLPHIDCFAPYPPGNDSMAVRLAQASANAQDPPTLLPEKFPPEIPPPSARPYPCNDDPADCRIGR